MGLFDLERLKKVEFQEFVKRNEEEYEKMDIKLDGTKCSLLTLEHYCERFIPIKI